MPKQFKQSKGPKQQAKPKPSQNQKAKAKPNQPLKPIRDPKRIARMIATEENVSFALLSLDKLIAENNLDIIDDLIETHNIIEILLKRYKKKKSKQQ